MGKKQNPRGIAKTLHDAKVQQETERKRDAALSKRTRPASPAASSANPASSVPRRDMLISPREDHTDISADQKKINFLLQQIETLKGQVDDFRNVVATLTHEIRAEDGAFRKKFNAKRRQVTRLKKLLDEHGTAELKEMTARDDVVHHEDDDDEDDVASTLVQLANEATEFLAKGLEDEEMEMDDPEPFSSPEDSPKADHDYNGHQPIFTDNYYSPLAEFDDDAVLADGDVELIKAVPIGGLVGHPLDPVDICPGGDGHVRELNSRQPDLDVGATKRALTSPIDRQTPPKSRGITTSSRRQARVPHPDLPPVPKAPGSRQKDTIVQTESARINMMNKRTQTQREARRVRTTLSTAAPGSHSYKDWVRIRCKQLEDAISEVVAGNDSWKDENNPQGAEARATSAVLAKVFTKIPHIMTGVLDDIGDKHPSIKEMKKAVEKSVCDKIQDHLNAIVSPLYALLNLTERDYQKLVNALSWEYDVEHEKHRRIKFKFGTRMPRLMAHLGLRELKKKFMDEIGLVRERNKAHVEAVPLLKRRIQDLVKEKILQIEDGMKLKVQVLGDATGIWKSMKVNGTTIVLKIMYDTPHGTKKEGTGVNSKRNMLPVGFYLGEDCLGEMRKYMSHLPSMLEAIQNNGIDVDGKHIDIEFWLGGDLKFVTAMLGMSTNGTIHPCPFCLAEDSVKNRQMHFTIEQLKDAGVTDRTLSEIFKMAHLYVDEDEEGEYQCPCCEQVINKGTEHPERTKYGQTKYRMVHFMVKEGEGPFFPFIPIERVIVDILHLKLRITPVLWRITVSNHVDKEKLVEICQEIYNKHKIIISKGTAVQSSTGQENKIGSTCWPGKTCDKILIIFREVMDMVHSDDDIKKACIQCWNYLLLLLDEIKKGCDDSDPDSVEKHAERTQALSEHLVQACIDAGLGMDRVTPYLHISLAHLKGQIKLVKSLSKGSSQGAEFMHQDMQDLTKNHTNKNADYVCSTALTKELGRQDARQDPLFRPRKGKEKEAPIGGHLRNSDRQAQEEALLMAKAELGEAAYKKPTARPMEEGQPQGTQQQEEENQQQQHEEQDHEDSSDEDSDKSKLSDWSSTEDEEEENED